MIQFQAGGWEKELKSLCGLINSDLWHLAKIFNAGESGTTWFGFGFSDLRELQIGAVMN